MLGRPGRGVGEGIRRQVPGRTVREQWDLVRWRQPDTSRLAVTIHLDDGHQGIQKTFVARPLTFHEKPENQILM